MLRQRIKGTSESRDSYTGFTRGLRASDGQWVDFPKWSGGRHCWRHDFAVIDDVDPRNGINRSKTNPVRHLVTRAKIVNPIAHFKPYDSTYSEFVYGHTSIDVGSGTSVPSLPSSGNVAIATDEAYRFFGQGCTKTEVSIPLFVWELGECKRVASQLVNMFQGKSSARNSLPIGEEFGITPVIRDLKDTYNVLTGVGKRLEWMRKHDGQPVKVRFSKELPTGISASFHIPYYSSITWHNRVTRSDCKFRAHARIRYNVRYLGDAEIKLRTLMASLGFLNPAKVVWDHIPFSFLIDKLVDIGNLLERFSMPFVYNHNVEDMGWSIKVEERSDWSLCYRGQNVLMTESQKTFYERNPGLKLTFGSPVLQDPTVSGLAYGLRFLSLAK